MKKILTISLLAIIALSLAACNGKENRKENETGEKMENQQTMNNENNVITDSKGISLYILKTDSYNQSTCEGKCIQNRPAYYNENKKGENRGEIVRKDGKKQTTYKGWPLYYYVKDKNPGDKYGDGKGNKWFLAKKDMENAIKNMDMNVKTYTKEEVAKHNNKSDCRTIINNKVYSITSFFGKHPGGDDKLEKLCGTNGTELFMNQHGNNEKAKAKLENFYKGELKN